MILFLWELIKDEKIKIKEKNNNILMLNNFIHNGITLKEKDDMLKYHMN